MPESRLSLSAQAKALAAEASAPSITMQLMHAPLHPATGFYAPFAKVVVDYAQAQGVDTAPLHTVLGLSESQLNDPGKRVSSQALAQALATVVQLCGDPAAPLRVAQLVRPAHLGTLGYALLSCTQGQTGLAQFEQMQTLLCNEIEGRHHINAGVLETWQTPLGSVPRDTNFWVFFVASRLAFARWVSGRHMTPLRIDLPCPAPVQPAAVLDFFGGPVRFNTPDCRELMPAQWLSWLNPNADPGVHGLMSSLSSSQWQASQARASEIVTTLTQRIAQCLHEGRTPTLDVLAAPLSAPGAAPSVRQMQRRLATLGISFKSLVEGVRKDQALNHLRHTDLPLAEVAQRAGYAEASAFHRAVRRWTGMTPLQVRDQSRAY